MKLFITRDSVCAADDVKADHLIEFELDNILDLSLLFEYLKSINYLPKISGGKSSWALIGYNPICVIAQQWAEPKFVSLMPEIELELAKGKLKFCYFAQCDPNKIHEVLISYNVSERLL